MAKNNPAVKTETEDPSDTYAQVCSYLETYAGSNPFLLSVKSAYHRYGRVSDAQLRAVWETISKPGAENVDVSTVIAKKVAESICVMPGTGRKAPMVPVGKFIFKANLARDGVSITDAERTFINRFNQERPYFYGSIDRATGAMQWGGRTTTEERKAVANIVNKTKLS